MGGTPKDLRVFKEGGRDSGLEMTVKHKEDHPPMIQGVKAVG